MQRPPHLSQISNSLTEEELNQSAQHTMLIKGITVGSILTHSSETQKKTLSQAAVNLLPSISFTKKILALPLCKVQCQVVFECFLILAA